MALSAEARTGLATALGAYVIWGVLPIYFKALEGTPPWVILAHRVVWAIPSVLLVLLLVRRIDELVRVVRQPRLLGALLLSSIAVAINWALYIWAVSEDRILEGSLGYFINPLITFLVAALFFGERFSPLQIAALLLAGLGVLNEALVVGSAPWVALGLAVSWACYAALRKQVDIDSRAGLLVETLWLAPVALVYLALLPVTPAGAAGVQSPLQLALLLAAGPITAIPLILFAMGARRLRLSTLGALQYVGPTLQFAVGIAYGEPFSPQRSITFGCIWAGVALFTFSAIRLERQRSAAE